jgi:hypothetical protein
MSKKLSECEKGYRRWLSPDRPTQGAHFPFHRKCSNPGCRKMLWKRSPDHVSYCSKKCRKHAESKVKNQTE